ncbi:hypothetical protein TNCV_4892831 [Trichonephila clavipes]|nr:hypothetical protein TNCV_4892831 [Trichonephila clavipes]
MSRSGSQYEAILPVYKSPSKLGAHLSTHYKLETGVLEILEDVNRFTKLVTLSPLETNLVKNMIPPRHPREGCRIDPSGNVQAVI